MAHPNAVVAVAALGLYVHPCFPEGYPLERRVCPARDKCDNSMQVKKERLAVRQALQCRNSLPQESAFSSWTTIRF